MKKLVILFVLLAGCATANEALPRIGHSLDAVKDAYLAVCEPPPDGKEAVCENARVEINKAVVVYTQINDAAKASQ